MHRAPFLPKAADERPIDPRMIELVRALARQAALEDHRRAMADLAARRTGNVKK